MTSPTEIDHYQIQRVIDIYVNPDGEDLGALAAGINRVIVASKRPAGVRVALRGMVQGMEASFTSFGLGLILAMVLLYLILVAQFRSFLDPASPGTEVSAQRALDEYPVKALAIVHEYWRELPRTYRRNVQLRRHEEQFENWDCSISGFEAPGA